MTSQGGTQESTSLSNKLGICMLGCRCTTKCRLANDLIIEQITYNIIASISPFKVMVKMFWFTTGVCKMMATSSKSLSYKYLIVLIACILVLRVSTEKHWDRGVSLQYASQLLCTVSQLHIYSDYHAWNFQSRENYFTQRHIYSALIVSVSGVRREFLKIIHSLVYLSIWCLVYIASLRKGFMQ